MNSRLIVITICMLSLLFAACVPSTPEPTSTPIPTPTSTPSPKCQGNVCIRRVFVSLDSETNSVFVEFDLVDQDGKVKVGDEPRLDGKITVGIFRVDGDVYLWGAQMEPDHYVCYAGNDIPWSNGELASSCGFTTPANQMQVRPKVGDLLRIEVIEFDLEQTVTLEARNK